MVCYVSKWVRVVYLLSLRSVSCPQWCVMLVSGSVFFLLKFVVMCVGVFYLRSVSCPQWCVMLVSGVPCCLSSFCVLSSMVCDVSKWGPWCLSSFCVLSSMVCYVSKWVRVVYLRSVSCAQWCVMLVSGVRVVYLLKFLVMCVGFFIFVLCPVLNGVLC